jgi:trafficking protein particle complex subunit 10
MLSQAVDVYALVGTARDKQWVNVVLGYLKLCSSSDLELLTHQDDSAAYIANIIDSLKAVVDNLSERSLSFAQTLLVVSPDWPEPALLYPEHPALSIQVLDTTAAPAEDEDGSFLNVSLRNLLPCVSLYLAPVSVLSDGGFKSHSQRVKLV